MLFRSAAVEWTKRELQQLHPYYFTPSADPKEADRRVDTALIGDEPCYVVDDSGFRRHIPSEQVDRVVLEQIASLMKGSEDLLSEQTAKMLGQEDVFTKAAIESQMHSWKHWFRESYVLF